MKNQGTGFLHDSDLSHYIIEDIADALRLADSPVRRDMDSKTNIVPMVRRAYIVTHCIETTLKSLIGEGHKHVHSLGQLLNQLRDKRPDDAEFLDKAFLEATTFYHISPEGKGFKHFKMLEDYLSTYGDKTYEDLRYWILHQSE